MRRRRVELLSPSFVFRLDTRNGLHAVSWENRLTGQTLSLGDGNELGCTLDAAARRITIAGWRAIDDPASYRRGFQRPEFDDSQWKGAANPAIAGASSMSRVAWARTHVFVPADCAGRRLSLVLGGIGVWDFREMRVFLNGQLIGTRRVRDRWHAPGQFDVTRRMRLGQDNVVALELRDQIRRTERLDKLDPQRTRALGWGFMWPAQFEQFVVAGEPLTETAWRVKSWRMEHERQATFHLTDSAS